LEYTAYEEVIQNMPVIKISNSRMKLWRRCHYAHHLRYNEKLEKKAPAVPLIRGKVLHELIESRINKQTPKPILKKFDKEFGKLFNEEKAEIGDLPSEVRQLFEGYIRQWEDEDLTYLKMGGKRAEFEFEVPLIDGVHLYGLIDTVARDGRDRIWLMEHKTHKTLPNESARFTDLQTILYCWVLPQIGFPKPTGVLWDYIRTKLPTVPEPLKKGGLSKAKDIDTTYEIYMGQIKKLGLDPKDYTEVLDRLKNRSEVFYKRVYMPAPATIMATVMEDARQTAWEIKILGGTLRDRNITKDCSWCSYYSICQAELRGFDTDFIRKTEYAPRKDRKDEKETGESEE
jgi:hypothetical protein